VIEREGVGEALAAALEVLRAAEPFDAPTLEAELGALAERLGTKPRDLYQPLRVAITGTTVSPGIFESLAALGRDQACARVQAVLERLQPA
jgi:glutamyl-tRNA synthetase